MRAAKHLLKSFAFPVGMPQQLRPGLAILWLAMAMAVLAHVRWMPLWAVLLNLVALGVHAVTMMLWPGQRQKLDNWVAIALMVLLTQLHHDFPNRETGIAIFPILFIFKIRQLYRLRDYHVACMMAIVQTGFIFLYQQSILMMLYVSCISLLLVYAMARPHMLDSSWSVRGRSRQVGRMCLYSMPFLVLLFILFPRIPGPLWSISEGSDNQAQSGITENLKIGGITNLVLSDKVAFRATFTGENPKSSELYWRGPVLWLARGDGSWGPANSRKDRRIGFTPIADPVSYTMTMEPGQGRWLFALGLPAQPLAKGTTMTSDLQLRAKNKIQTRQLYQLQSYLQYTTKEYQPWLLQLATQLPPGKHPKTRALAKQWLDQGLTPQQMMDNALGMFNQSFNYSLTPPAMINDVVDEFLFTHQTGFCSHFAIAFTSLMRAAGIPARVVVGFQGGQYNDIGNYFTVREQDAHAWVEVWQPQREGWVRVDPTAAVAPERIESGMASFLSSAAGRRAGAPSTNILQFTFNKRLLAWVDAMQHQWNQNVLQYDRNKQYNLLQKTGLPQLAEHPVITLFALLLLLAAGTAIQMGRNRHKTDPAKSAYDSFCMKLKHAGVPWHAWQAPLHRSQIAEQAWPRQAREINSITKAYLELRYGTGGNLKHFQRLVRKFHIN